MGKPFVFRLEKLLEIRRLGEKAAERELAVAERAVAERNRAILELMKEEDRARSERRLLQAGWVDLRRLALAGDCQEAIARQLVQARSALGELVEAELRKRRALTDARKAVRVLERFRERQLLLHRAGEDGRERSVLDEVAQNLSKGA